jgi:predicted transcriptional regulator of viral defense system
MGKDPRENERSLWAVASEQGGYFTASQALAVGYSYPQQHFHSERGNWFRVDRGVFRLREYPPSAHEDLIRWALWSRDRKGRIRAVASHDTALSLHEFGEVMPGIVHLTVPPGFRKRPAGGCVLHRAPLATSDIERRDGFLVTTTLRTLLDVAESDLSPEHLAAAVSDALARGEVRRSQLLSAELSPAARQRLLEALVAVPELAS